MATDTKASLRPVSKVAKGLRSLLMGIFTKATTLKGNHRGLENTIGQMEAISKGASERAFEMGMGFGKDRKEFLISMRVSMLRIGNVDMGFSAGRLGMFTKGTILVIVEMAMVKCIGMMAATIKANGRMGSRMDKDRFICLVKVGRKESFRIM